MTVAALDWTAIVIASIGATVAIVNGLGIALVLILIRTPSGMPLGKVAEQTHAVSHSTQMGVTSLVKQLNGDA